MTLAERIEDVLLRHGPMSAAQIAIHLAAPTVWVRRVLDQDSRFERTAIEGLRNEGFDLRRAA